MYRRAENVLLLESLRPQSAYHISSTEKSLRGKEMSATERFLI